MQGTMMNVPLTLPPLLDRAAALFGQREIVSRRSDRSIHRYRYADLQRRVRALAQALGRAGLKPGDRVATLMWNDFAHLEAYFGIPLAGGVLHTLNLRLPPEQLGWILNDAADRFLIVDETLLPLLAKWRHQSALERVFVVRLVRGALPPGIECYEDFIAEPAPDYEPPVLAEDDACGLCYTSGTTGNPKGVLYTHRSSVLHSLVISLPDAIGLGQQDSVLPVVPMFHVNAWGIPYAAVMAGSKIVLPGRHLDPVSLLELFEQERVNVTAGVPSIWLGLLEALDREPTRWKLERMRMIVGGAAAPEALIRGFDRHGQEVIHAWGMTETSPVGTVSRLKTSLVDASEDERYRYRAMQGMPAPLVEVRIMADAGAAPHDGSSMGELQVRGPWVASSYYGSTEEPDKFTADGWFRTGDVATLDAEGYVKLVDRIKDLVKSGGEWISSVELESALMCHAAVREACVVAVPHPKWGERPMALIKLHADAQATAGELRAHLAPSFPSWWLPEAFTFVDEIPKTSVGKFLKRELRERFASWSWE
jgi:acyl-CoA synthetase (AMP-forming)/AMP-acid ligase II